MGALFETVPNFSSGPFPEFAEAVAEAIETAGAHVLDLSADTDHNRTVVSVAGAPATTIVRAGLAAVAVAVDRLDLPSHRGVHPRVGVADVLPVVPLLGSSMEEAIATAHQLGERIWTELSVPVFLYARAARRPASERLADIRTGRVSPDFGGPDPHPTAGAVCVGARPPLVAYNIQLPGLDAAAAAAIARQLRSLEGVQALAFELKGPPSIQQLSMNLVDLEQATLATVHGAVLELAPEAGPEEVVGLCPAAAARPAASGKLLEARLAAAAAVAAAGLAAERGDPEGHALAGRLRVEGADLAGLQFEPDALLAGGERAAALLRILRAARIARADLEAMLEAAARGLRAALAPATERRHPERVRLLDRWLAEI